MLRQLLPLNRAGDAYKSKYRHIHIYDSFGVRILSNKSEATKQNGRGGGIQR